jgi:acetolactate synthase I/II/III large subunit
LDLNKENVSDYLISRLVEEGVRDVFLLPGGGCMYIVDAIARNPSLRAIPMLHEQGVGIAAEAYAQFSGRLGVAIVTTGPGATNAITPCAAAWTDSTPLIFISGQVKTSDNAESFGVRQLGFQEVPIIQMVKPITKLAVKITSTENLSEVIERAISTAVSGRPGPVWLDIPLDIQNASFFANANSNRNSIQYKSQPGEDLRLFCNDVARSLKESKRPVIIVGNGVRLSNSLLECENLIRKLSIPVLLTWKMIDFLDNNDHLNFGRPGNIPQPWSNIIQENSDLILVLGARMDTGQTAYSLGSIGKKAKKIVVDIDKFELSKFPDNGNFIKGNFDVADFIPLLTKIIGDDDVPMVDWSAWLEACSDIRDKNQLVTRSCQDQNCGIDIYDFVSTLSSYLTEKAIVVPGSSGACSEVVMQAFKVKLGQRIFNSEGLGAMGFGVPGGLGAAIASRGERVVVIDGDGGFLMNMQELATIRLHQDTVLFFVLNNNGYGSIKITQDKYFDGRRLGTDPSSGLALIEISQIAKTFGYNYQLWRNAADMKENILSLLDGKNTSIVEILVCKNQKTLPKVRVVRSESGELLPADMSNMEF